MTIYVKIIDDNHKHFGRTGELVDYNPVRATYRVNFGKVIESRLIKDYESTEVFLHQIERTIIYSL